MSNTQNIVSKIMNRYEPIKKNITTAKKVKGKLKNTGKRIENNSERRNKSGGAKTENATERSKMSTTTRIKRNIKNGIKNGETPIKNKIKESNKRYREENKEKINQFHIERLHNDSIYKMKEQTRNMIRYVFRSKGHHKTSHTVEILGCDLDFLCEYLFKTWEKNYGRPWDGEPYHIDHIVPLATAKTKEDIIKLCHYTNLQMLTPEDNMAKSDKV